ncbi:type II toxin-antitoxin system VapC family toxin (plasmid) [Alicyclobacillus fastidiosus]|uniref:Ribonuclease VapC n=2 Tax=Alicyclobacillus fastidiosus TaxID=392011 RepID=A0ABY6ZPV1_9BACL|nr:type II toxin-antitoxin system VapC family toxin [Alicyclobacillus fastidiosus]GMA66205.1 ribonuclease VapC [Alicyclobacillus fastidiosus]GMA66240.1 ribonuclease VapC [Alicyclobacillus fastidiosus]
MLYMLDTNICIYLIKKRSESLLKRMRVFHTGEIGVSVMTVAELQYGVSKSVNQERNQTALEAFLLPLEIAEFTTEATVVYGRVRAELERQGRPIGPLDTLIAAHALSLDVPLVTNNTREFERVSGLRVENWTDE